MSDEVPVQNGEKSKSKRDWKLKNFPHAFLIRAADKEYLELKKMAKESGLSLSRMMIEGTLSKTIRTEGQAAAHRADLEEMIFQMRRIGINLNQITCALNAVKRGTKASVTEEQLETAAREVESLIAELRRKL